VHGSRRFADRSTRIRSAFLKAATARSDPLRVSFLRPLPRFARSARLAPALALALGAFSSARAGEVCEVPSAGPVALVVLASESKVQSYARTLQGTVIRRDAKTVVFLDGRVVTSDIEAAGRHLNALGWGSRPIDVVASFAAPRARPRRSRG